MKKTLQVLILLSSFAFLLFGFKKDIKSNNKFYYAYNKKIFISDNVSKLLVTFNTVISNDELEALLPLNVKSNRKYPINKSIVIEDVSSISKQSLISLFKANNRVRQVVSFYKDENDFEVGFTDEILLKFKDNISVRTKDSIIMANNLNKIYENNIFGKFSVANNDDVLDLANKLQESNFVVFSHPNLVFKRIYCNYIPNDPFFPRQFYLQNTGQIINDGRSGIPNADIKVTNAWDITKGNNAITVAVLDMGVTSNHPDLPNSRQVRLPGSNFYGTNPYDPSPNNPVFDYHGNASAGIIAATQDNNEGISGAAPYCKIMPINTGGLDDTYVDAAKLSSAIEFARANGADIIYNGWSTSGGYPDQVPAIVDAINNATLTEETVKVAL